MPLALPCRPESLASSRHVTRLFSGGFASKSVYQRVATCALRPPLFWSGPVKKGGRSPQAALMRVQEEARQKDRQKMTQSPVGRRKATKSQSPPLDQATAPVSDGPVEPAEEKAARAAEEEIDRALEELIRAEIGSSAAAAGAGGSKQCPVASSQHLACAAHRCHWICRCLCFERASGED